MTVSSSLGYAAYAGNGSTTVFSTQFAFYDDTDLVVTLVEDATDTETVKVLTTHYTVAGGDGASGNVTMLTAPASGYTLVITREVPFTQETDYAANDTFPAEAHETALDKLTMLVQQVHRDISSVPRLALSFDPNSDDAPYLPLPVAGEYLVGNDDETGWTHTPLATITEVPVVSSNPQSGDVLAWNGSAYVNTAGAVGAPAGASYLVLGVNATLTSERVLTAGTGISFADTGANGTLTVNAADMATARIKGRTTAGTGAPEDLTAAQATALLSNMVGDSGAGGTKGLVPAPSAGDAAAGKVLKADGTWGAGTGGWTFLETSGALSAVASWETTVSWTGYNFIRIEFDVVPATDSQAFRLTPRKSGPTSITTVRWSAVDHYSSAATAATTADEATAAVPKMAASGVRSTANTGGISGVVTLFDVNGSRHKRILADSVLHDGTNIVHADVGALVEDTAALISALFSFAAGNIASGRINVWAK